MKDPSNFVINVYANLLDNLTVGNKQISLYDRVMGDAKDQYMVFDDINLTDISDMDSFQWLVEVDLQIITIFKNDSGGKKLANDISSQVLQTLYSNSSHDSEFRIYNTQLSNAFFQDETQKGLGYVIRKFISIQHLVEQK